MNTGYKLYKKAKNIILGGNMLLSKRPEMFLPDLWPSYFTKAKGISVWDLDKIKYTDMICAVGQNILGYANSKIDNYVSKNLKKGNMTTLNCPEEVYLAKKLVDIHPWADMAKFSRSGGEANAIAVRIARSASRKDNIAVCGYHGWHDWYLSINLNGKEKLNKYLLKGLNPIGVPKFLKDTVHTFSYNDFYGLERIVKKFDIGVIKMEVGRNSLPNKNFLEAVRKLADKKKIILIFDECTSGFRRNYGGLHLTQNVEPDIAMFGKALGNGYAINAVLGKKNIMMKAEGSFISSTFWTERIGFSAAIKTLELIKQEKTWEHLIRFGSYINNKWISLAKKHELEIEINGIESITSFIFKHKNHLIYKTYITQEMMKKGYLASNLIYLSKCHNKDLIDKYIEDLDPIFKKIKYFQNNNISKNILLKSVCHDTFKRLN
jgi:glutamate-1-semialdehyde aminotransferase